MPTNLNLRNQYSAYPNSSILSVTKCHSKNFFCRITFLLLTLIGGSVSEGWGQPYIRTSGGYGAYGYVEKDATATNFLVANGGHGNIYQYGVKTYVTGPNANQYNYTGTGSCARGDDVTSNFDISTLQTGSIMYSSVFVEYCGPTYSCGSMTPTLSCFNERSFFVLDLVGKTDALSSTINYSSATSNVVLTFTLSNNNTSGQTLDRLWIENDGSASETTDLLNEAFRLYYEAATGSETFDGTESYAQLYGDYASNSSSNNIYGHDDLNIAIPQNSTGGLRCYVVLAGTSTYLNTSAIGKTVRLSVMADGISITPNRNTSFNLMRMNATRPSDSYLVIGANYYSKSTGNLEVLSNWGLSSDGTGTAPSNFTTASMTYEIRNRSSATIGSSWTISGANTRLVVGDGTNATDFTIPSGLSLTLAGGLTNNSTISGDGKIVLSGSSAQTISGTGTISNLEINNSAGVTISGGSNMQSLTGTLTPTAGALTTNGNLILKSNASTTARVGQGSSSGGYVSGDVTVERYFGSFINKRAWRLVTAPVATGTGTGANNMIFGSWQSTTTNDATGILIWAPGGDAATTNNNGLQNGPYSSMRGWTNSGNTPGFSNVLDSKNTPLFSASNANPESFFLFVTGPYSETNISNPTFAPVRLSAKGELRQGDQTFSVSAKANQFYLVGNPYASPVNLAFTGGVTMTNTNNSIWLWDPNLSGSYSVGGYVSFDRAQNTYSTVSGMTFTNSPTTPLQSGQAFFVQATADGSLTVAFKEDKKVSGINNSIFRSGNQIVAEKMRLTLQRNFGTDFTTTDGAVAFFYPDGANQVDEMDGVKLMNSANNLMFRRSGTNLTFEHRPLIQEDDTLFVRLQSTSAGSYRLIAEGSDFNASSHLQATLEDTYLGKEQPLSLETAVPYDFTVDGNTASSGDRFRIVFKSKTITPPQEIDLKHTISLYPNPIQAGESLSIQMQKREAGKYTIAIYNLMGVQVQQQVILHASGNAVQNIKLNSNLPAGTYLVNILDASSKKVDAVKINVQ